MFGFQLNYSKTTLLLFLYVAITFKLCFSKEPKKVKEKVFYSLEQMNDEKEIGNINVYPKPILSDSAMRDYLHPFVSYPPLAKKNLLAAKVYLEAFVNTNNKIDSLRVVSPSYPLFDTTSIKLIEKTKDIWQSGFVHGNKFRRMSITIPVQYYITYERGKVLYNVKCFFNTESYIVDSSESHPAIFLTITENESIDFRRDVPLNGLFRDELINGTYKSNNSTFVFNKLGQTYSTKEFIVNTLHWHVKDTLVKVEVGVVVDTNNQVVNAQILKSYNPEYDSEVVRQIKNADWICAKKNGNKISSYIIISALTNARFKIGNIFRDGESLFYKKDYKNAKYHFTRIKDCSDNNPEVFYYLGLIEWMQKNPPKACENFMTAKDIAEYQGYPLLFSKDSLNEILKDCGYDE